MPIRTDVKDYVKLDTIIHVSGTFFIDVDDAIPLDQKVKLPLFGKSGPNFPVTGNIKLKQSLKADLNEFVPVTGLIPIDMLIVDTLPIGVHLKIPVNLMVPVKILLKTTAKISFSEPMPVNGIIPLALSIPVDIPLNETDLALYFKKMAMKLRNLTDLDMKVPE